MPTYSYMPTANVVIFTTDCSPDCRASEEMCESDALASDPVSFAKGRYDGWITNHATPDIIVATQTEAMDIYLSKKKMRRVATFFHDFENDVAVYATEVFETTDSSSSVDTRNRLEKDW